MTESNSHRVVVIGSDGQPVGYADVPGGAGGSDEPGGGQERSIRPTRSASRPR